MFLGIWLIIVVINYLFIFYDKNYSHVKLYVKIFNVVVIKLTNTIAKDLYIPSCE
jgi:hypothetical protein